ncbi:MAG: hypothetical protein ABSH32_16320 [Bryobacteraceae bacterium]|jgi:hypothetical protein
MQQALQYCAWGVGLWLNLLVISALLRGSYRQYPFAFAYAVALLLSTIAEIAASALPRGVRSEFYWVDEVILDILVFCVVIAFIDHAAADVNRNLVQRRWLITAAALIFAASFIIRRDPLGGLNRWMTLVSRDLNICAVILDLMLWSLLLASRRPNRRLLLLSGGLGIQLTGAILGESVRGLSRSGLIPGTLLEVITGLLGLYVWWRAFRPAPVARASRA